MRILHSTALPLLSLLAVSCSAPAGKEGSDDVTTTASANGTTGNAENENGETEDDSSSNLEGITPLPEGVEALPDGTCPKMCEEKSISVVPVDGGGPMCTFDEFVPGTDYPGASQVSFEGAHYTANWWTNTSPGLTSGSDPGSPWAEGVPCPGGGSATEEVITTKMVCCAETSLPPIAEGSCVLDAILGEVGFNTWFRVRRDPFYTYTSLCLALEGFPGFAATGDATNDKREVAAFFANVARETGELDYIEQFPETRGTTGNYFGRGPIQLTWDFNYKDAGEALDLDLLGNPDLVATDGVVTWQAALWFWMKYDGSAKGTCHDAIAKGDFGQTINIINGGLECFQGNDAASQRIAYYKAFSEKLSVDPGTQLQCW